MGSSILKFVYKYRIAQVSRGWYGSKLNVSKLRLLSWPGTDRQRLTSAVCYNHSSHPCNIFPRVLFLGTVAHVEAEVPPKSIET
jgi:hypothetical protein